MPERCTCGLIFKTCANPSDYHCERLAPGVGESLLPDALIERIVQAIEAEFHPFPDEAQRLMSISGICAEIVRSFAQAAPAPGRVTQNSAETPAPTVSDEMVEP